MIEAVSIMRDWLGEGGQPVHPGIAASRAGTCEICPFNKAPKWWESAKVAIAETMRAHIAHKNSMAITVPNEASLGVCSACGCCLPLKVHVPIEHIKAHADLSVFPEFCWITREAP